MNANDENVCSSKARGMSCPMSEDNPHAVLCDEHDLGTIAWLSCNQTEDFWEFMNWLFSLLKDEPPLDSRESLAHMILAPLLESLDGVVMPSDDASGRARVLVKMNLSLSPPADCCSSTKAEAEHERQFIDAPPEW